MANNAMIASIVIIWVLAFAGPSTALHCNGDIITIDVGAATFYLDDRSTDAGEIDHWFYMEDNGIEGLQSGSPCSVHDCWGPLYPILMTYDHCMHWPTQDLLIL